MANSFFKLFGALLFFPLLLTGVLQHVAQVVLPDQVDPETGTNGMVMAQIAATHTVYIAVSVVIFSTLLWPVLLKLSRWAAKMPAGPVKKQDKRYLDPLLLGTPSIAIEQCVVQLSYMTKLCHKNITAGFQGFVGNDLSNAKKIAEREVRIDDLQNDITSYLVKLSGTELTKHDRRAIPRLIHCINDAERIGDHAENLVELTEEMINHKQTLDEEGRVELVEYFGLIDKQFSAVLASMDSRDQCYVAEAMALEDQINEDQDVITQRHVQRLEAGICSVRASVFYLDMVANLEKIGDHLTNIAERLDVCDTDVDGLQPLDCSSDAPRS